MNTMKGRHDASLRHAVAIQLTQTLRCAGTSALPKPNLFVCTSLRLFCLAVVFRWWLVVFQPVRWRVTCRATSAHVHFRLSLTFLGRRPSKMKASDAKTHKFSETSFKNARIPEKSSNNDSCCCYFYCYYCYR